MVNDSLKSWQEAQLSIEQTGGSGQESPAWNKRLAQHVSYLSKLPSHQRWPGW